MTRRVLLRLLMPAALVALALSLAGGRAALDRLAGAEAGWLVAALALVSLQTLASAWRWSLVAGAIGLRVPPGRAVAECYLAQLVNQTLPGGVLGDVARAGRARAGGWGPAARSVVIERAAGQAALLLVTALGFAAALAGGKGTGLLGVSAGRPLLAVLGLTVLVGMGVVLLRRAGPVGRLVADAGRAARVPGVAALSLVTAALNLLAFAAAARATGTALPAVAVATLVPLILMAMLLPASIAGWGWREGAAAALFPLAGASAEAGVAASLAFGLVVLLAALPGAWVAARPAAEAGGRGAAKP